MGRQKKRTIENRLSADEEYLRFIKPVMIAAKLICIWPLEKNHTSGMLIFRICHMSCTLFMLSTMCIVLTADVIYHFDDLDELTEVALICSAYYLTLIRSIVFLIHHKDVRYVVEIMREDWVQSSYEDRVVLKEKCYFAFQLAKYFITMVYLTIFAFLSMPILESNLMGAERVLPFRGHFFVNQTVSPVYECLYAFSMIAGIFAGSSISGVTGFNLVLVTHGAAKFAVLQKRLEAINSSDLNADKAAADCVKRHLDAITFADALERIINVVALGQFIISTGLVCFAGFQISSMLQDKTRMIKYSSFLNAAIVELFIFSFSGNQLSDESDAVSNSAYNCDWVGGSFGRSLQMIMIRSKITSKITAAKFYSMSLESFSKVLSTSFSYMMVLMASQEQ